MRNICISIISLICATFIFLKQGAFGETYVRRDEFLELKKMFLELKSGYQLLEKTNKELKDQLTKTNVKVSELEQANMKLQIDHNKTTLRLATLEKVLDEEVVGANHDKEHRQFSQDKTTAAQNSISFKTSVGKHWHSGNFKRRRDEAQVNEFPLQSLYRSRRLSDFRIAFYANNLAARDSLGYHQTLIFNQVTTNIGNGYNGLTGIFTCGSPGVYVFYFNLIASPGVYVQATLVKNGAYLSNIHAKGSSDEYLAASNVAITYLSTGDSVWVQNDNQPTKGENLGTGENSFAGFLLYPM